MVIALIVYGCIDAEEIGLELIDSKISLNSTDTLTVKSFTIRDDSVPTSFVNHNVLGLLNDPVFGTTKTSIYTETRLTRNNISLGEDPVLDSVFLVLYYQGDYYGNVEVFHNLRVYELSENFPVSDTLYSNQSIPHKEELITLDPEGFRFRPAPRDSVMVDSVLLAPHIRIPLSDAFGQRIIDASKTPAFENIPNYLEAFKGLYITLDSDVDGMGALYKMDLMHLSSAIDLYYHNPETGEGKDDEEPEKPESKLQRFLINEFSRRGTRVEHFGYEEANPLLQAQVVQQDPATGDSLVFLQSLGLLRAEIELPFLEDLDRLDRVVINKAELILPVNEGFITDEFLPPARLTMLRYSDEGQLRFLTDYFVGQSYFGGAYDEEEKQYSFNISQHIQLVLDGRLENTGLALLISGNAVNMSRLVLNGPGHPERPMKIVIHYTTF